MHHVLLRYMWLNPYCILCCLPVSPSEVRPWMPVWYSQCYLKLLCLWVSRVGAIIYGFSLEDPDQDRAVRAPRRDACSWRYMSEYGPCRLPVYQESFPALIRWAFRDPLATWLSFSTSKMVMNSNSLFHWSVITITVLLFPWVEKMPLMA